MHVTTRPFCFHAERCALAVLLALAGGCADEDETQGGADEVADEDEPGEPRGMLPGEDGLGQGSDPVLSVIHAPLPQAFCQINVNGVLHDTETDYIPRVIACENGGANFEALKAQAIAARSVAYYEMANDGSICDGQGCQVYSCNAAPKQIHYDAAKATAGQYLSYNGWLTYAFFVAGDPKVAPASCVDTGNGSASATEKWVTFNAGKSGYGVAQTGLGTKFPADVNVPGYGQNRGCMSQWGARCLENSKGWKAADILRFYYGADIQILQAAGACVPAPQPPGPPPKPPTRRVGQSSNRDYNGDGRDDVFWYQPGDGADPLWLGGKGGTFQETFAPNVKSLYFTLAGDFDGDGNGDVFFYAPGALPEAVWNGTDGGSFVKSTPKDIKGKVADVDGAYAPIAGDFDGDGVDDVLWYAPGPATDWLWYGAGDNEFANVSVSIEGDYLPVAGDFDGDGRTDVLWYGGGDAPEAVWYGRASRTTPFDQRTTNNVEGLYLPFAGDFDGDGRDDIFWYAPGSAADNLWRGTAARGFDHAKPLKPDGTAWNVQGDFEAIPGDYNGDGRADILWYGRGADPDSLWLATGGNRFTSETITVSGTYAPI